MHQVGEHQKYKLKDMLCPMDFYSLMKSLHPIHKNQFLNDLWNKIIQCEFRVISKIYTIVIHSHNFEIIIEGILNRDYNEAAEVRKQEILNKLVDKYGTNNKETV
jgi:hypothetical protein